NSDKRAGTWSVDFDVWATLGKLSVRIALLTSEMRLASISARALDAGSSSGLLDTRAAERSMLRPRSETTAFVLIRFSVSELFLLICRLIMLVPVTAYCVSVPTMLLVTEAPLL